QAFGSLLAGKAEIEQQVCVPRHYVGGTAAGVEIGNLEAGGREVGVAAIPLRGSQLGQRRQDAVHRVAHQLRIGDVAAAAAYTQPAVQRATPAIADHVTRLAGTGRFTDHAPGDFLASCFKYFDHTPRAVDGD